MRELFEKLEDAWNQNRDAVMLTVIESHGSTPRGVGSRMLLCQGEDPFGTIGGGAVEYEAVCTGKRALDERKSFVKTFSLTREQAADIGMVCGGEMTVFFQYLSAGDAKVLDFCRQALSHLSEEKDSWLWMDLTDPEACAMGFWGEGEDPAGKNKNGRSLYVEPFTQAGRVYVFGGGHVAQELVPLLSHVGFRCVVFDDREDFADPALFPDARVVVAGDFLRISDFVTIGPRDYVCIMTRGHQYDYQVQKQVMPLHPCYIGIMGSRNKVRVVTEQLLQDGFSVEEIENCHMPIGTAISAETPAEIAVSIAGELISVRARREGREKKRERIL